MASDTAGSAVMQYLGVGCITTVAGFFSGAMILVMVAKVVGMVRRCTPPEGLPACDWHVYALAGGVLGAFTLPFFTIRLLRRSKREAAAEPAERG